jgi:hypothetical protein
MFPTPRAEITPDRPSTTLPSVSLSSLIEINLQLTDKFFRSKIILLLITLKGTSKGEAFEGKPGKKTGLVGQIGSHIPPMVAISPRTPTKKTTNRRMTGYILRSLASFVCEGRDDGVVFNTRVAVGFDRR